MSSNGNNSPGNEALFARSVVLRTHVGVKMHRVCAWILLERLRCSGSFVATHDKVLILVQFQSQAKSWLLARWWGCCSAGLLCRLY